MNRIGGGGGAISTEWWMEGIVSFAVKEARNVA